MSTKLQQEVFQNIIAVPGCTLSRCGLTVDNPSADNFRAAFGFLQTIEGCSAWWWGDLINTHADWAAAQEHTSKGQFDTKYNAGHWAREIGREESTLRQWVSVAAFYPPATRNPALPWAHHAEAMHGAGGDPAVAQAWLDRAEKEHWSKTDLRAEIRSRAREQSEPNEPLPSVRMQEVTAFNRWARTQLKRVAEMDPTWREQLRSELEAAAQLIAALDGFMRNAN